MERFNACFAELDNPRTANARHALNAVLIIGLCAMPCGGGDCSDMAVFGRAKEAFLRQFFSSTLAICTRVQGNQTFS
jgi:hypothetical protein